MSFPLVSGPNLESLVHFGGAISPSVLANNCSQEEEVLGRLKASLDDPLALEAAGYALFDMYAERRGNLFSDEVYRLSKAHDACTSFLSDTSDSTLPPNHKFSTNDVIMLTYQPNGAGDIFGADRLPTSTNAIAAEARILNTGPTYVDIAMNGGAFEAAFGPAPNDGSGNGNRRLRLRIDRFLSNVPYQRMVSALSQMTTIPENRKRPESEGIQQGQHGAETSPTTKQYANICMDEIFRETIISTFMLHDPSSIFFRDTEACDLREVAKSLSRPPLPNSATLANQVLSYMQTNPHGIFASFNGPQLTAIGAALTRRLTMVQGPPGTGKVRGNRSNLRSILHYFSLAYSMLPPSIDHSCRGNCVWLRTSMSLHCSS